MGGKKKPAKPKESRVEELRRVSEEAFGSLAAESPRACPLIAAEWLSNDLELLLRARFAKEGLTEEKQNDLLNGYRAPFDSFAMRIIACRSFGVLPPDICDSLHAMREIRNYCGHAPKLVSLDDKKIAPWVRQLSDLVQRYLGHTPPNAHRAIISSADFMAGVIFGATQEISLGSLDEQILGMLPNEPLGEDRPST